jgi:NAD(P)-dependent dehydrogenase (short-subunit alcohol dehydrogenase family)
MHKAIVTGGTRGIGLAIARALLADGASVIITGRDRAALDAAQRSLATAGGSGRLVATVADVRERPAVENVVALASKEFGGLDTLINNAGVGVFADVEKMDDDDWNRIIDTNLTGVFLCTRAAIPVMRKSGGGWIINIASLAGKNYFPKGAAYCASKAGLVAFTESLMQEVRYDGIRVSVIMPGSVATEFGGSAPTTADAWKLTGDDVAEVVMDLLRHPSRSLPSRIEMRPSAPPRK